MTIDVPDVAILASIALAQRYHYELGVRYLSSFMDNWLQSTDWSKEWSQVLFS